MARSRNPDLIFDDVLSERADRVSRMYFEGREPLSLDRVTLFVTHRCNLRCVYCNGPHLDKSMAKSKRRKMLSSFVTFDQYASLVQDWAGHNLKNIHFTGGEATLHPLLPDFVRAASEHSIPSTLTTNGMAEPELYQKLVDNGLSEIRVSIDSTVDEEFDSIVSVKGACQRVKNNIKMLADMRDKEGKGIFIILNACVGSFNVDKVESTLSPLIGLNPDDIKLLVIAEEGKEVQSRASRKIVDKLVGFARTVKPDCELLERKIRGLFRKNTFGITEPESRHVMQHCFVPLTERTLDAREIYPCSIYLRYKGAAIASAQAGFDEQQEAIRRFIQEHDCRDDPICKDNCTSCCKRYNVAVNKKLRVQTALLKARKSGIIRIDDVAREEIESFAETYARILNAAPDDSPFMIIKPYGLAHKGEILSYLESQRINVVEVSQIGDWKAFSLFLYCKDTNAADVRIARNKAYSAVEMPNSAIFLRLEKGVPEKKLNRLKIELREWYGEELHIFSYKGEEHFIRINCAHTPEYSEIPRESRVAGYFLGSRQL